MYTTIKSLMYILVQVVSIWCEVHILETSQHFPKTLQTNLLVNIWVKKIIILEMIINPFVPNTHFPTPWKHQKTVKFSDVLRNGLKYLENWAQTEAHIYIFRHFGAVRAGVRVTVRVRLEGGLGSGLQHKWSTTQPSFSIIPEKQKSWNMAPKCCTVPK